MSDDDVATLRDLGLMEAALGKQLARLRAKRNRILNQAAGNGKLALTDHSIVRFMERVTGTDMEWIKERFRQYVAECERTAVKNVLRHPRDGMYVILNPIGTVVTIVPELLGEDERKLKETGESID